MSKVFNMVGGGGGVTASIFVTGLSQTDTVTATNGSKTLNGKWTQRPNPAIVVPDGYTQLEYIESTGTQYIDTGFVPNQDTRVILDHAFTTGTKLYGFGVRESLTSRAFMYTAEWNLDTSKSCVNYGSEYSDSVNLNGYNRHIVDMNKNNFYQDNILIYTFTYSNFTCPSSIVMFAINFEGGLLPASGMRCYSSKIYDNDVMVRDFIPTKRNSDSAIGLYDLVSSTFFENAGTGEFTAGAEVPQTFDGFLIKPIRDFGTWTVTATNGTKTDTQDVLVDVITNYKIEMSYKLWLYRDGDECEDVTGGWSSSGYTTGSSTLQEPTKNNDSVTLYCNTNNYVSFIGTVNPISFKGYSKLKCFTKNVSINGTYAGGTISFDVQKTSVDNSSQYMSFVRSSEESECEIDISEYQGTYFVCAKVFNATSKADLTKVWLE